MKLIIDGAAHDLDVVLSEAQLIDLYHLKVKTGIGLKTLAESLQNIGELEDPMDFVDDEAGLLAFNALIWLCRRRDGETDLTLEQAGSIRMDQLSFEIDDDEEEAPDPTSARTDSGPGDEPPATPPDSSRTSTSTSDPASSSSPIYGPASPR